MKFGRLTAGLFAIVTVMGVRGAVAPEAEAEPAAPPGVVSGVVTVQKDGNAKADRAGVVVYLEGVPTPSGSPQPKAIHQKDLSFSPGTMVVVKGTTVEFPNDDKVFHNVFSVSKAARFDLGLYKSGTSKSVTFKRPGVVDVYCNIHPQMAAKIKVVDSPHYAITRADGSFTIKGVPPGTYPIVAWVPYGTEHRGEVKVSSNQTATVKLNVIETHAPQHHTRKDGTPYGRYQ